MTKRLKISFLFLPLFILSFGLESCGSAQNRNNEPMFENNPPFKIEEAYYQKWVAGIEEGGSGINVYVHFATIDPTVVIQDIYFYNHVLEAKNSLNAPNEYVAHLSNDSKRNIIMDQDPMEEAQNIPLRPFPIPFQLKESEAVVSYWFGGNKNYFKISTLSEKNHITYPQTSPNN